MPEAMPMGCGAFGTHPPGPRPCPRSCSCRPAAVFSCALRRQKKLSFLLHLAGMETQKTQIQNRLSCIHLFSIRVIDLSRFRDQDPRSGNEHPQNQKFQIQNSCRNLDYPHPRIRNCKSIVPDSNPRTPEGPGPGFRIRASPDPNTCIFNPNLLDLISQITSRGLLPSRTLEMKSFSVLVRFFLVVFCRFYFQRLCIRLRCHLELCNVFESLLHVHPDLKLQ